MTIGEQVAALSLRDIVENIAQKPMTKRILADCIPALRQTVDHVALAEYDRLVIPGCFGRHVFFASPKSGMVVDMLSWSDPLPEIEDQMDNLRMRAALWGAIAQYIDQSNVNAALAGVASRLGKKGIAQFEVSLTRADTGEFSRQGTDNRVISRGALVVLAGIGKGQGVGTIGCLPVPVCARPEISDWHTDGNHRVLH